MKTKEGIYTIKTVQEVTLKVRMNANGEVVDVIDIIEAGDIVGEIKIIAKNS